MSILNRHSYLTLLCVTLSVVAGMTAYVSAQITESSEHKSAFRYQHADARRAQRESVDVAPVTDLSRSDAVPDAADGEAVPTDPIANDSIEAKVKVRVRDALGTNPTLQGAWVDVIFVDGKFEFRTRFDSDEARAKSQELELRKLLESLVQSELLEKDMYTVTPGQVIPVKKLLADLSDRIESVDELANTFIYSAYFKQQAAGTAELYLMLQGYVNENDHRDRIVQLCDQLMDTPTWRELTTNPDNPAVPRIAPNRDEIRIIAPPVQSQVVRERLYKAVGEQRNLQGAWVRVVGTVDANGENQRYVFEPVFDSDESTAQEQRAELDQVLNAFVGEGLLQRSAFLIVARQPRPLKTLLADLRKLLQTDPEFTNCMVFDAYYKTQDTAGTKQFIMLQGRVTEDAKKAKVASLCERLIPTTRAWYDANGMLTVTANPDELRIVNPSKIAAPARERIYAALKNDQTLHGTWVDVVAMLSADDRDGTNPHVVLTPVFDADAAIAKAQEAALSSLVKKLVEDGILATPYEMEQPQARPVRQLLATLKVQMAGDNRLKNCLVYDAYFEPQDEAATKQFLTLLGRVATNEVSVEDTEDAATERKVRISALVEQIIEQGPAVWRNTAGQPLVAPNRDHLITVDLWAATKALRTVVWDAIRDELALRGLWINISADLEDTDLDGTNPIFVLKTVFEHDAEVASNQEKELTRFTRRLEERGLLEAKRYEIEKQSPRPLLKLLSSLQAGLDQHEDLQNAVVNGAYYEPQDVRGTKQFLTLQGRIATDAPTDAQQHAQEQAKKTKIVEICEAIMRKELAWHETFAQLEVAPKTDQLKVVDLWKLAKPIRDRLISALAGRPGLRGVWVDVAVTLEKTDLEGEKPGFIFNAVFDSDPTVASLQETELRKFIEVLKADVTETHVRVADFVVVKQRPRPLKRLIAELNARLRAAPSFDNCLVCDAYYRPASETGDHQFLTLVGRATSAENSDEIVSLAGQMMQLSPVWENVEVTDDDIRVIDPAELEDAVRRRLRDITAKAFSIGTRRLLTGTWIDVNVTFEETDCFGDNPQYRFTAIVDAARAEEQEAEIRGFIEHYFSGLEFECAKPQTLPISQLLSTLQDQIESDTELDGCLVVAATLDKQPTNEFELNLHGRIRSEEQRTRIRTLCEHLMECDDILARSAHWYNDTTGMRFTPSAESLQNVAPSSNVASGHFNRAYNLFWRGCYSQAHADFRLAYVEDSNSWHYLYWLALCEIQMDQKSRAYRRIRPLIWRVRAGQLNYRFVLLSLERVQLKLRAELRRLEHKALADGPPQFTPGSSSPADGEVALGPSFAE